MGWESTHPMISMEIKPMNEIQALVKQAAQAGDSQDAMRLSQAALNLAHVELTCSSVRFYSEEEAMDVLADSTVTYDSNRWIDCRDATRQLSTRELTAIGYLCANHSWTVNGDGG